MVICGDNLKGCPAPSEHDGARQDRYRLRRCGRKPTPG